MKTYGVCIGRYISEGNFVFFSCKNKTEARKKGNQYRRAWQISDPILKIVEIPKTIQPFEDNENLRAYAVQRAQ
jgi:hypothetical protein